MDDVIFRVLTPIGFTVRVTAQSWHSIATIKHPLLSGKESLVKQALEEPMEIRRSKSDSAVYLFYSVFKPQRWICAVAKKTDPEGFLITAYVTDSIKEGELLWKR